jgi:hypothetical protein
MNRPDDRPNPADTRAAAARLIVRRATVADAEGFATMMGHPEVFPWLLQMPHANPEVWRLRLGEMTAPGKADVLLVAAADRRLGFVEEGRHRCGALRDGAYVDCMTMARLNPAPLRGFPRD